MPMYMDIHRNIKATPEDLRNAHQKDLEVQGKHGANFREYWFNEKDGTVFCLSEAPSRDALESVHREAHGLLPDEIIEVRRGN
jgi:hypothetical protein